MSDLTEAQMVWMGKLPNGNDLYFADDSFERPGFYEWDGTRHRFHQRDPRRRSTGPKRKSRPWSVITPRRRKA